MLICLFDLQKQKLAFEFFRFENYLKVRLNTDLIFCQNIQQKEKLDLEYKHFFLPNLQRPRKF